MEADKLDFPAGGARRTVIERVRPFAMAVLLFALAVLVPFLGQITADAFRSMNAGHLPDYLAWLLVADTLCVLLLCELALLAVTRSRGLGRPLELRLAHIVAYAVLVPTAIVSIAAIRTIGVETNEWVSSEVAVAFDDALVAANDYDKEMRKNLAVSSAEIARGLNRRFLEVPFLDAGSRREVLAEEQAEVGGDLKHVFLIDGACNLIARGSNSYSFDILLPEAALIDDLRERALGTGAFSAVTNCPEKLEELGRYEFFEDGEILGAIFEVGEARHYYVAVVPITSTVDRYLHTTLEAIPSINNLHATVGDDRSGAIAGSQALFRNWGTIFSRYSILFLGFAVATAAMVAWAGIILSGRLSRPLREISGIAKQVAAGDMELKDVRLSYQGDNEVRTMAIAFKEMTSRLHLNASRLALLHEEAAERERVLAGVLSNVTSGVVGLDAREKIVFANQAARELLKIEDPAGGAEYQLPFRNAAPEMASLLERLGSIESATEGELFNIVRGDASANIRASVSRICDDEGKTEGFVMAFDDVTDLLKLQQQAAWKEAAQRFAHDLGNPITPIMLAADFIKESMSSRMDDKKLERLKLQCDIIADESERAKRRIKGFRQYAEMAAPRFVRANLSDLVHRQVALEDLRNEDVQIIVKAPDEPVYADIDSSMISAALTNLLKNADESLRLEKLRLKENQREGEFRPSIAVEVESAGAYAIIRVTDNGMGLGKSSKTDVPKARIGRGYGLLNVRHYADSHGGTFALTDALALEGSDMDGAEACIRIPVKQGRAEISEDEHLDFKAFEETGEVGDATRTDMDKQQAAAPLRREGSRENLV